MKFISDFLPLVLLLGTSSAEPRAIIVRPSPANETSVTLGGDTFTGDAMIHENYLDNETWIGRVVFPPSARTYWHSHEKGQLLRVVAGSGWVCDQGAEPQHLRVGDIAWCPPGITHWHGAEEASFLVHEAIAYGATEWLEAVTNEEYSQAGCIDC